MAVVWVLAACSAQGDGPSARAQTVRPQPQPQPQTTSNDTTPPPEAVALAFSVDEDSVLSDALSARTATDGLTFQLVDLPALGTASLLDVAHGQFVYTPAPDRNGNDRFTYRIGDAQGRFSGIAEVSITIQPVNDAPRVADVVANTLEDTAVNGLFSAQDVDGDALQLSIVAPPGHGKVDLVPGGGFRYAPSLNFNGADTFSYAASDGQAMSNVAQVTVQVAGVNDAPVAVDDNGNTNEGQALTLDVLANDSDVDGDKLKVAGFSAPSSGTVTQDAGGKLIYTPRALFSGNDSFTYTIDDGHGASASATVRLTVAAVNHVPQAAADQATTLRNTAAAINVLANDSNLIDKPVTVVVTQAAKQGLANVNADNTITYTPVKDYLGGDSFDYKVQDGNGDSAVATVLVTVNCGTPCVRTVRLTWAPNAEPNISGYNVYHGTVSGVYPDRVWVAGATTNDYVTPVTGKHYFALTAVDSTGAESGLSVEVAVTIPVVP